jgi:hypothetical protein
VSERIICEDKSEDNRNKQAISNQDFSDESIASGPFHSDLLSFLFYSHNSDEDSAGTCLQRMQTFKIEMR